MALTVWSNSKEKVFLFAHEDEFKNKAGWVFCGTHSNDIPYSKWDFIFDDGVKSIEHGKNLMRDLKLESDIVYIYTKAELKYGTLLRRFIDLMSVFNNSYYPELVFMSNKTEIERLGAFVDTHVTELKDASAINMFNTFTKRIDELDTNTALKLILNIARDKWSYIDNDVQKESSAIFTIAVLYYILKRDANTNKEISFN